MRKLLHVFTYLFISIVIFISYALSDGYIPAEETGETKTITIKAKPDLISSGTVYSGENESQIATWFDTAYKTDGNIEGFYFEVTGGWNPWGGEYNNANEVCGTTTVHKDSTTLGNNGEYDYITSSYRLSSGTNIDELEQLPTDVQRKCWLTGGSGLYIAFFGESGYETPDLATHLKMADIACDPQYSTDKNGDGVFTMDECYSPDDPKNNQAYYVPYKSEYITSGVRCDLISFKYKPGADPNKIRVSECIEKINDKPINRAVFTFSAPYLYKDSKKTRVSKNEVIKFTIYDSYYSDNTGGYNIKIFKGASTEKTEGVFEKIMKAIESMFSISANTNKHIINNLNIILATTNINNYNNFNLSLTNKAYASNEETLYQDKVGLIKTFYNYIVRDSAFINALRILLALYISFFGLNFAMGGLQYNVKDFMTLLLKLTFVLVFTMPSGWDLYNEYVVTFFLKALMYMVTSIINIINKITDPIAYIYIPEGTSLSSIFINMDSVIFYLFSDIIGKRLGALVCGNGFGWLLALAIIFSIVNTLIKLTTAAFPIMISYIEIMLGLMLGPIFISFYLFKTTESIFMNWLSFLGSRCANIFFTATILLIFIEMIKAQYKEIFNFSIYTGSGWEIGAMKVLLFILGWISYGTLPVMLKKIEWIVYFPDYTGADKFDIWGAFFKVLGLNIIIQFFGVVTKHLPAIIDSLVEIKGGKGGKMKDTVGNTNLLQAADSALNSSFNRKKSDAFFTKFDTYSNFTGALMGVGGYIFKKAKETYDSKPDKKTEKEESENYNVKRRLMGASYKANDKFKDLFSKENEEKVDKLVQSIRKGEKNVSFSDDPEENRKFHELRKYYVLMKNEEDFGKYIRNDRVDIRAFLKDHKGISNEDREMLIDSITTQINLNTDFDYYARTQELAERLANFDPDKASDKEAEKLRKDLEELQRFRNDIEDLLALRSGQGLNTTEFLMSGVDLDRFGLQGAQNFTAIAGINASSFLGFNNGAANIASGMGIQLVEEDEYADDKDDDKKKILSMKNMNSFQMNNSLVSFLTTKINELRAENDKINGKYETKTVEEKEMIDRNDGEISKLLRQRTNAQKRVYESANSNSLLDALENLTAKSNNPNLSEDKREDIRDSKKLLMAELKARYNSEWLDSEEIDRFNQILDKESNKDEFEEETKILKKVGKSRAEIYEAENNSLKQMQKSLAEEYSKNSDTYKEIKNPGITNSAAAASLKIDYRKHKIKELQNKDNKATGIATAINNASIKRKEKQIAKKEEEIKILKEYENLDDYTEEIANREDYIKKEQEEIERLKAENQKAGKLRALGHKMAIGYQKHQQNKQEAILRDLDVSKKQVDAERIKREQRIQDIQNIRQSREELFKINEHKQMLEMKRNKYIEMLALNEKAKAKSTALSLSSDITRQERLKLQRNCEEIEQKNIQLRKEIEEYNKNLLEQTKLYQTKEDELNSKNEKFTAASIRDQQKNEKELNEIRLQKEQVKVKINKTKNAKHKEVLQKEFESLSNYEKYYLKEQELQNKSIALLNRQKEVQERQESYRLKKLTDKVNQEMEDKAKDLIVKEITVDKSQNIKALITDKKLEIELVKREMINNGETAELLARRKNLELDLKILSARKRRENAVEIVKQAKEANLRKIKDTERKVKETSNRISSLNRLIKDEQDKSRRNLQLEQLKYFQKKLLEYQIEKDGYEKDMMRFENGQKKFDQEKQNLQESYTTKIFTSEHNRNQEYFETKQDLIKARENQQALELKSKEIQDNLKLDIMLENEHDKKLTKLISSAPIEKQMKEQKDRFISNLQTTADKAFLKWDEKKNKEAIAKQTSDIEKMEQTLNHIENKPVMTADTETAYREKSYEIEQKAWSDIETYCQKYLDIVQDTPSITTESTATFDTPAKDVIKDKIATSTITESTVTFDTPTKDVIKDKTAPTTATENTIDFDSFIKDAIKDEAFDEQVPQDFLDTVKNTTLDNGENLYDALYKTYNNTADDKKEHVKERIQNSLKDSYEVYDNQLSLQDFMENSGDLLKNTSKK